MENTLYKSFKDSMRLVKKSKNITFLFLAVSGQHFPPYSLNNVITLPGQSIKDIMIVFEVSAIVAVGAFFSAWAVYWHPKLRRMRSDVASDKMMVYTQRVCSYGLLPCERDMDRMQQVQDRKEKDCS